MSRLEKAVVSIVEVFEEYAGQDDKKRQLSSSELQELLQKEMSNPEFQGKIDPEDIKEAMEIIDKNHDGEVNFREFSRCVSMLALGYFHKKHGKAGKRDKEGRGGRGDKGKADKE
ncbi:S100 calcium binding protein W [Osmerus eperlanus]|uniref:S100 calcium binding protein W n=1 Tax=Osmerus eperlanus TaxID=29151 RepID=UPI002E11EB75